MAGDDDYDDRVAAAVAAREAAYGELGEMDPHVMGAAIDEGPPFWPSRRAYVHIRRPGRFIIASWGLSDPWAQPGHAGYGYELVIEVDEAQAAAPWVFPTILHVAEASIAPGRRFRAHLDALGTLSNEIGGAGFPDAWRSHTGRVGLLFGVPIAGGPDGFETPDGDVRIVPITLLHPRELAAIVADDGARDAIAAELGARTRGHASLLDRELASGALDACEAYVPPPEPEPERRKPWWKRW